MHATVCLLPRFVFVTKRGRNVSPCVSRGLLILRFRKHSVDDRALRSTLSHSAELAVAAGIAAILAAPMAASTGEFFGAPMAAPTGAPIESASTRE